MASGSPRLGLSGGGAKLPRVALPGCSATRVSAWRTAEETPSTTGTGSSPASERASPANGAPANTMTSAPNQRLTLTDMA